MEPINIADTLASLKNIMGGRTINDLISNVDKNQIKESTAAVNREEEKKISDLKSQDPEDPNKLQKASKKISKTDREEKKKKKKKDKKDKEDKGERRKDKKKDRTQRYAAGETWVDPTLADWPENDFRIWVGNLGNEVTDENLSAAFKKYASFNKARIVRDNRTGKSKGFGFISIQKVEDYIKLMREMDNVYLGSRPIRLQRCREEDFMAANNKGKTKHAKFVKSAKK